MFGEVEWWKLNPWLAVGFLFKKLLGVFQGSQFFWRVFMEFWEERDVLVCDELELK